MDKLLKIIARLRAPDGCPWDQVQTHESLKPYLLEETYELLEALDENDDGHLVEEMGDVLLQLLLHSQLKAEQKRFTFKDVVKRLEEKMIFRHPHVFKNAKVKDLDALNTQWETLKNQEKMHAAFAAPAGAGNAKFKMQNKNLFYGIPKGLPSLMRSQKIQGRAAKQGFDWPSEAGPLKKISEELRELKAELSKKQRSQKRIKAELGDILFSVVNLCRKLDISAEDALRAGNLQFEKRVQHVRIQLSHDSKASAKQIDRAWRKAKV